MGCLVRWIRKKCFQILIELNFWRWKCFLNIVYIYHINRKMWILQHFLLVGLNVVGLCISRKYIYCNGPSYKPAWRDVRHCDPFVLMASMLACAGLSLIFFLTYWNMTWMWAAMFTFCADSFVVGVACMWAAVCLMCRAWLVVDEHSILTWLWKVVCGVVLFIVWCDDFLWKHLSLWISLFS